MDFRLIAEGLRLVADGIEGKETAKKKPVKETKPKKEATKEKPVVKEPKKEEAKEVDPLLDTGESKEVKKATKADVMAAMAEAISSKGRDSVIAILSELKAKSFSEVKEKDYNLFIEKMQAL